jgi:hypothetical protein
MAIENNHDPLRNPQVDYERADLSARGILFFLIGLLLCGVFIELVVWGMFRFMAKSDVLFPQPKPNPMVSTQRAVPETAAGSVLQNFPAVNTSVFPEPRLQVNDAGDMSKFLKTEEQMLNPEQPFTDSTGAVHISISQAMKLLEERGLPVRPGAPPGAMGQPEAGNASTPAGAEHSGIAAAGQEPKQP